MIIACGPGDDVTGVTIATNQGIVGHVFNTAEPMVLQSKAAADSPLGESDDATGRLVNNQIVVPLRTRGRQPFGCIQLVNKKSGGFSEDDLKLAKSLAALVALDIEDKGYSISIRDTRKPMIVLKDCVKEFPSGDGLIRVLKGVFFGNLSQGISCGSGRERLRQDHNDEHHRRYGFHDLRYAPSGRQGLLPSQ